MSLLKDQPPKRLSDDHRQMILDREIAKYIKQGYRIVSREQFSAQLIKDKHFSCFWITFWTLTLVGWIPYLLWYFSRQEPSIYLSVAPDGRVGQVTGKVK